MKDTMIPYRTIAIEKLELNNGQLAGLPKNPRYIRDDEYEKLKRSIAQSPEFLEARMLLVYPLENGNYIVIAGNMRLRACRELGYTELPCYVFPKQTTVEKLREYTIKDNANFGNWDYDILANESWSDDLDQLAEWGAPVEFLQHDGGEVNIDDWFEEASGEKKEKDFKIEVIIPHDQEEILGEITDIVKSALTDFEGVKVK